MDRVVQRLRSGNCRVVFLTGAGVSTSSGIPDFRSLGGMYDTLRPDLLTASDAERDAMRRDPTVVVSWDLFRENQLPYLELRRPFILGQIINESKKQPAWKPSLTHCFMSVCEKKGVLSRVYTQNIDGLDFHVPGLSHNKIIPVHGSLAKAACEFCSSEVEYAAFASLVSESIRDIYDESNGPKESSCIRCPKCQRPGLKPTTVLYGRSLPAEFFENAEGDVANADILFINGTSLTVSPANQLVPLARSAMRVLINRELVGKHLEFDPEVNENDVALLGACDDVMLRLSKELGWHDDLVELLPHMAESSRQLMRN